ncbi:hypothetical protein BCR39DRAFT_34208 [Naematelia encephala]|uniref:Ubiquinol-cytochrome-c reductase complex subunit-domain-containing protein n=1 Tax=Naematelia encephala TaxID=71784 RepID=A0A1Y2BM16_9TREE|nr:hypothetical protein BCR39DRAFT_34208 [Naematelia encephala]
MPPFVRKPQPSFAGFTPERLSGFRPSLVGWGVAAGAAVALFMSDIPVFQKDVLRKIPVDTSQTPPPLLTSLSRGFTSHKLCIFASSTLRHSRLLYLTTFPTTHDTTKPASMSSRRMQTCHIDLST